MKSKQAQLTIILEGIEKIINYSEELEYEGFLEDSMTIDAIMMQLIHIGEIAKKYEKNFAPDDKVPISEMIAMRNFIAHEYLGLNRDILYDVVKNEIPKIQQIITNKL